SMVKKPCEARTLPKPAQVGQLVGRVPGFAPVPEHFSQETLEGTRICAVFPVYASDSVISRLYLRSAPRSRPERFRLRRPPMNSPNRSSKMSDIEAAKSGPKPPAARPPPSNAAWPN